MRLIKGKFYDNVGNVVPLEFGNKDQIRLIEERRALEGGGITLCAHAVNEKLLAFSFRCPCGQIVSFDIKKREKCLCGEEYEQIWTYPGPVVKLMGVRLSK